MNIPIKDNLNVRLDSINRSISKNEEAIKAPGLFHGKMGIAIYFYQQFKFTGNKEWEIIADKLIDQIYDSIGSNIVQVDFESGLAGIGWGFEYLVQNGFVEANTDEILEDIDNKIFQHIIHTEEIPFGMNNGVLGYASYVIWRLKCCNNTELRFILERLHIEIIKKIGSAIEKQATRFAEPAGFNLLWELPLLLLIFGETLKLNIYRSKILRILDELNPLVCTLVPILQCNRAFLLFGLNSVLEIEKLPLWEKHAKLLAENICIETIINQEFSDKNIFLTKGLAGALIVIKEIAALLQDKNILYTPDFRSSKIVQSAIWNEIQNKEKISPNMIGFVNGLSGLGFSLLVLESDKQFAL